MNDDKLKDLIPLSVTFFQGESPTAEKLEGMMKQVEDGIQYLEETSGDAFNRTEYSLTWLNNYARAIGSLDKLNPTILPSYIENNYEQFLTAGESEHELDFIPIGDDTSTLISASADSSVAIGQYKESVDLLETPGDWTILSTYVENGNKKHEKRLVTHSPADGATITFSQVGTGKGTAIEGARHTVIPTVAQATSGGPFIEVVLSNESTNTYTFTLPDITKDYNSTGEIVDVSLSNTSLRTVAGRKYKLPSYFFDPNGLDLASDSQDIRPEKTFPGNLIKIYTWEDKQVLEGILEVRASQVPSAREYQFDVRFDQDVLLDLNKSYMISVSGIDIAEYLKILSHLIVNHTHAGEDMGRFIKHSDLMKLRTTTIDVTNRSRYYGPSNIDGNDHSMYLHRDGYKASDVGAGGNILRGDFVIGNTETGLTGEHENYNLTNDSYSLYFGHLIDSARFFFEKAASHSTVLGRKDIAKDFVGEALSIIGPVHSSSGFKNIIIDGALRVVKDTVLGSTVNDTVVISGNAYINQSATFIPLTSSYITSTIPLEEGTVVYNLTQRELEVYNGSARLGLMRNASDITVLVGDGISSWGKYNGTDINILQNAINEAATTGGIVRILKGTYDIGYGQLTVPSNIRIVGSGSSTTIIGDSSVFSIQNSSNVGLDDLVISGRSEAVKAVKLINIINSSFVKVRGIDFKFGSEAVALDELSDHCRVESDCTFEKCNITVRANSISLNKYNNMWGDQPVGFTNEINMLKWGNKEKFMWKLVPSGVSLEYVDDAPAAYGRGSIKVQGVGSLYFDEAMPVSPSGGCGGFLDAMILGTVGEISVGANCYDSDMNLLGTRNFIASDEFPGTSMTNYYGTMTGEGTNLTDFIPGTRFIKFHINIQQNDAGIYLDNIAAYPMTISRLATFA